MVRWHPPCRGGRGRGQVIAFASTSGYRARECYAKIAEFSVYVARARRGSGAGRVALAALITASSEAGLHKLVSRIFPENVASRGLCRALGFREVGVYQEHGQLEGVWKDLRHRGAVDRAGREDERMTRNLVSTGCGAPTSANGSGLGVQAHLAGTALGACVVNLPK